MGKISLNAAFVRNRRLKFLLYWELYLFILPALAYLVIFDYFPMYGIQIAFKNFNPALGIAGSRWVGFTHFKNFFNSFYFWRLIRNTFALSVYSMVLGFPMPIIFALMLNEVRMARFKKITQTVMYAPHFISMVVMVGIINIMLSPSIGAINRIIETFGGTRQYFMVMPSAFRHIYVWSGIWQNLGWSAVIYLAALSTVDPELHEAAIIDGASRLQRIISINIPTIMPTIIILLIMRLGNIASVGYEKVYLMRNDLNVEVSEVISTYVYQRGLVGGQFSFTAAIGLFNNLVNVSMLLAANFIAARVGENSLF
jgi:putative aldouronate transport system permease protein